MDITHNELGKNSVDGFLAQLGIRVGSVSKDNLLCFCPFHGDVDTPSLSIRTDGAYYCFSPACNARGRSFSSLAQKSSYSKQEAGKLVEAFGLPEFARLSPPKSEKKAEYALTTGRFWVDWEKLYESYTKGIPYDSLIESQAAGFVFGKRRLSPHILQKFDVGVDREYNTVVFPIYAAGRCVGVASRSPVVKAYRYSKGFNKKLHTYLPPSLDSTAIIVEGQLDALAVRQATKLGTSICGSILSDAHAKALARCDTVIVFLDNDTAGVTGTAKAIAKLGAHKCKVVTNYYGKKDPGDMAPGQITETCQQAIPATEYLGAPARYRLSLIKSQGR